MIMVKRGRGEDDKRIIKWSFKKLIMSITD